MRPTNKAEIKEIDTNVFRFHKNEDISDLNQENRTFAQILKIIDFLVYLLVFFVCLYFLFF